MGRKWLFTFHYASTISSSAENIPFTFHYASTISLKSKINFLTFTQALHSTMLLLYLLWIIIISVSILSLHSTMLLLYPKVLYLLYANRLLYIPLCFYYIPFLFSPSIFFNTGTLFVYLLSSLISFQKLSTFHFTKYKFPLIFQSLSISQQFFAIEDRQS